MRYLKNVTAIQLIRGDAGIEWKYDLMEIQKATNMQVAISTPNKIFLAKSKYGDEMLEKLCCAVFINFIESLKIKEKPEAIEVFELANLFLEKYPYESITDLILCLKMVKMGNLGIVYARFDIQVFNEFFQKYLELKYEELENHHLKLKTDGSGAVNNELHSRMHEQEKKEREKANKDLKNKVAEHFAIKEIIEKRLGG
jgi:hypothetical protein